MRKLRLILFIWLGWLLCTSLYASYYTASILSEREQYDAYAMNWQFQLMAFMLFRFPYMVLLLAIVVGVVIAWPTHQKASPARDLEAGTEN